MAKPKGGGVGHSPEPKKPNKGNAPKKAAPEEAYNPLAPLSPKEYEKSARDEMHDLFMPAYKQLGREQKRTLSMAEKRKSDNHYYLNWLTNKTGERQASEDAAQAALAGTAAQGQKEVADSYLKMQSQLVSQGQAEPGVVSNPGEANAFDVSNEFARDTSLAAAERQKTEDMIQTQDSAQAVASSNDFGMISAEESRAQADKWGALDKIAGAKQELRLTQKAEAAKEIARLSDREIQKSQIRGQLAASEAEAQLSAAKFGLDSKKLQLEIGKLGFEETKFGKKLGLEEQELGLEKGKLGETKRWHNLQNAATKADTQQEKVKASAPITSLIQENSAAISNQPKLDKLAQEGHYDQVIKALVKLYGSYTAAMAAVDLNYRDGFSKRTQENLQGLNYIIPSKWR